MSDIYCITGGQLSVIITLIAVMCWVIFGIGMFYGELRMGIGWNKERDDTVKDPQLWHLIVHVFLGPIYGIVKKAH